MVGRELGETGDKKEKTAPVKNVRRGLFIL